MRVSVCVTAYNEEESIGKLLESLVSQTKKADEIIIVDGKSTDSTAQIVQDYRRRYKNIKLHIEKCTPAEGRNIGAKLAKYDIVVMTDAGCIAERDWLEKITKPLKNKSVDVVAGFYKMIGDKAIQKAASVFLGVMPKNFNEDYFPSGRSIAFRKNIWKKVGGFPENLKTTAEDTVFAYRLVKMGCEIVRVKNARVEWVTPDNLGKIRYELYAYAIGDAESGIYWHPSKGLASHNIKVIFVFIRYLVGLILLLLSLKNPSLWPIVLIMFLIYVIFSFNKTYKWYKDIVVGFWGVILQFTSDFSVMAGFIIGLVKK